MTLLSNPADWARYTQVFAQENSITMNQTQWGNGPRQYPCLVASVLKSPMKVLSCYVYQQDALELIRACGLSVVTPGAHGVSSQVEGFTDRDFEKHTAALLLAVISELIEIKALKPEKLERAFNSQLAQVDQVHEENKDRIKRGLNDIFANRPHGDSAGE